MGTSDWEEEVANTNRYYKDRKNYLEEKFDEKLIDIYGPFLGKVIDSSIARKDYLNELNQEDLMIINGSSSERLTLDLIMTDTENNSGELSGIKEVFVDSLYDEDTDFGRYYTTFNDLVLETGVDMEIHYFRNTINKDVAPKTLEELYAINAKLNREDEWLLLSVSTAAYHMNGLGGESNTKFVLGAGQHFEAVYDGDGNLVTEDSGTNGAENMGTYNFAGPSDTSGHTTYDVNTYYRWGNTEGSTIRTLAEGSVYYNALAVANTSKFDHNTEAINNYYTVFENANPDRYNEMMKSLNELLEKDFPSL